MNVGTRLAAFAVVLAVAAGGGAVAGAEIGPTPDDEAPATGIRDGHEMSDMQRLSEGED